MTSAHGSPGRAAGPDPGPAARSCPSALCEEDALLLGVVVADGTIAYVQPPTRISAGFAAQARAAGHPERWFRFSAPCREAACHQWTGTGCGVIDIVIGSRPDDPATAPASAGLPACGIRRTCRWFAQHGTAACAACPQIIADTGGTATWRSWQQAAGTEPPGTEPPGTVPPDRAPRSPDVQSAVGLDQAGPGRR